MTPEQISLVEHTMLDVAPDIDVVAADFYRRLFSADPAVAGLFKTDPALQRAKFAAELEAIVLMIRRHDVFLARARALGARHAGYGARATHYHSVGVALLAALGAALGEAWTSQVEEAWRLAYNLTVEAMMAGAADAIQVG
jgi:hemoglobin-like flavoprotein